MSDVTTVRLSCLAFLEQFQRVCAQCGRNPAEITVVAVAKTRSLDDVMAAVAAGITDIGENRVQEAEKKYGTAERVFRLHMIGHLQSNKAKDALALFDVVQSVDSVRLAEALQAKLGVSAPRLPILLEVNTSGEATKYGFAPAEIPIAAEQIFALTGLKVTGLMTVGPLTDSESDIRGAFRILRGLFTRLKSLHPAPQEFTTLSMGMSDDYQLAIEEGSTMIRIGRAIFGTRNY